MHKQFRFRFFLGLLTAFAVGAAAVVCTHAWQFGRLSASLLAEANRAEEAGNVPRTADYLKRYLTYAPNDADALERYGRTLEKEARTVADNQRVLSVYEQVLMREPTRHALRRAAVDLALGLGDFGRARTHLEVLLHYRPGEGELEDLLGQCQEALGEADKAEASYRAAVMHAPKRVAAYARLAGLLRGPLDRPSAADQVEDDLVAANDHSADAYLERAAYGTAHGSLDDAERDAARARELAPDDARVLLATADLAARRGRTDEARAALRRGLDLHPDDAELRLALASLELDAGRPKEAAECVEEWRKALRDKKPAGDESGGGDVNSTLLNLLAEALLQQGRTQSIEDLAAEARKEGAIARADYFTARLLMYHRQWGAAARTLEESTPASVLSPDQAVRKRLCLARCYERLGDGDRRLAVLREAVASAPSSVPAGVELGAALLDAGRTDEALDRLRRTTLLPQTPEQAWTGLGRALLLHEQTLPQNKRDWREMDHALERCGNAPEAAPLRAAALRARGQTEQATALLRQACSEHPDQPGAWTALALDAARRGDAVGAADVLEEARRKAGDKVEFRLTALQLAADAEGERGEKTLSDLEKNLDGFAPEDRTLLLCRLAETYYRLGKAADGDRLCRLLAGAPAKDLSDRLPLLEAVLASEDDGLVTGVLADVNRLEGEAGAWQRYGRAAWLVARAGRGDRGGLEEARTLLADAARRRPDWSHVALLQGRVGELDGDAPAALAGYQRAFDLGERRPDVAQVLVRILVEQGRWDDADQALRKLQEQTVFHGALARQAAEVALQTHNGERAVELARLAAPAEDVYAYHLWLGRVLAAAGRVAEGEEELRRAVQFPDAGWDAAAALAAYLAQRGRRPEAEAVVEALKARLPARFAAMPLAECYEAAGRLDRAEQYYDEALAKRPDDGATLARVAAFDLRLDRPERAEPLLRRLLDSGRDASAADLAWARRELAMILAASGDGGKYDEAVGLLGLLGPERAGADGAADRRARAFMLGARPEGRAEALRRLEVEHQAAPLPADELFRLARLYDAAGDWPRARDRLVGLLIQDKQNPEYLAYLIDGLLRNDQADEAGPWVSRLEELESGADRVKEFRSRLGAAPLPMTLP